MKLANHFRIIVLKNIYSTIIKLTREHTGISGMEVINVDLNYTLQEF